MKSGSQPTVQFPVLDLDESLTSEEAANFLKVHKGKLLRYVKFGLPYFRMGKGFRFVRRDLIEFREKFRTIHPL